MKIYFAGSIRDGREDAALYKQLIDFLGTFGQVLTEHIGDSGLTHLGDDGPTDSYIHDRDLEWLKSTDVLVAEVTSVSMGVGYEIGRAVESRIKALCLYRPSAGKKLSAMVAGCPDVKVAHYQNFEEAKQEIVCFMQDYLYAIL